MAVITASLIAVGAAVASAGAVAAGVATVATIGTIAAVVGGVGLALGVAGQITGNKTLTKIGTYLGAAAAGGGLGAMAAQGMGLGAAAASGSSAATSGTGAAASSSVPETLANPELGASIAGSIQQAGQTGAGTVLSPAVAQTATGAGTVLAPTAASGMQAAMGGTALMSQSVPPPSREMPGVSYDTSAATRAPRPDPINDAYNIGVNNARSAGTIAPDNPKVSNTLTGPTRSEYTGLLGLAGMQMIGSTINGISQGQAASTQTQIQMDQNLAQNKLTQQQIDQAERQRAWERQNASYAPLVSFRGGLISNPGKA